MSSSESMNDAEMSHMGAIGHYLIGHGLFCSRYVSGKQRKRCCKNLSGDTNYSLRLEAGINSCCKVQDRIVLVNDTTKKDAGFLDCHHVAWFAPLYKKGLVDMYGTIDCESGFAAMFPPVHYVVSGHIEKLAEMKNDPELGPRIQYLIANLGRDLTECWQQTVVGDSLDDDDFDLLNNDDMPVLPCSCTQETCFLCQDNDD